jgi:hypothetical protein
MKIDLDKLDEIVREDAALFDDTSSVESINESAEGPPESAAIEPPMSRPDPNDYREQVIETHLRLDRLAAPQSANEIAAKSLIRTCREYGVGLQLDPDGTLVVQCNGRAWRSLVDAIEVHIDSVAELIIAGWDSTDA